MYIAAVAQIIREVAQGLSLVDVVVIVLLVVGLAFGFWTGFVKQLIYIASLIGSFWVAVIYHGTVATLLDGIIPQGAVNVVAAVAVFAACLLLCYLVAFLCRRMVNAIKPQMPDRLLGAIFGAVFAALLVGSVAFVILEYEGDESPLRARVSESTGAMLASNCARAFLYALPNSFREKPGAATAQSAGPDFRGKSAARTLRGGQ